MVCYRPAIKRSETGEAMNRARLAAGVFAALTIAVPAGAQVGGFDGINFVGAIRSGDNAKALELMRARPTIINARDEAGRTALMEAIARRDDDWTMYLISLGADPNLAARNGDTALITAARIGYGEAVRELVSNGARVDAANRMGETALIIAVQQRSTPIVKLLLERGANPDRADSAAGLSAREYAKRDPRARDVLTLIEAGANAKKQPKSDKLDDFKL
jgi:ankyrin repeat protein